MATLSATKLLICVSLIRSLVRVKVINLMLVKRVLLRTYYLFLKNNLYIPTRAVIERFHFRRNDRVLHFREVYQRSLIPTPAPYLPATITPTFTTLSNTLKTGAYWRRVVTYKADVGSVSEARSWYSAVARADVGARVASDDAAGIHVGVSAGQRPWVTEAAVGDGILRYIKKKNL